MGKVTIRAFLLYILGCLQKLITFVYYGFNQVHIEIRIMKSRLLIIAIFALGLSACSQYTCPTYAKQDTKKQEVKEQLQKEQI